MFYAFIIVTAILGGFATWLRFTTSPIDFFIASCSLIIWGSILLTIRKELFK